MYELDEIISCMNTIGGHMISHVTDSAILVQQFISSLSLVLVLGGKLVLVIV